MAMAHGYGSWLMALTLLSAEIVFLHSCLNFRTRLPVLIQSPLIYFPGREILEAQQKKKKKKGVSSVLRTYYISEPIHPSRICANRTGLVATRSP